MNAGVPSKSVKSAAHEQNVQISKVITSVTLAYLAYIAAICPCRPEVYKCHLTHFYVGIFIVVANLFFFNGPRITSYN